MKKFIVKSYGKKGQDVVDKNYQAVDRGGEYKQLTVDPAWANLPEDEKIVRDEPAYISDLVRPINAQNGELLPVSAYQCSVDGTWEQGTAAYEKRGVAAFVPDGTLRTVSSVTSVHSSARTLVSARSYSTKTRLAASRTLPSK